MDNLTGFNPNWASMPGETIADILSNKNLTLKDFSKMMDSSLNEVKGLLHGFISIDEAIAKKLNGSLGGSVEYWLRREQFYREKVESLREAEGVKWLKELPLKGMLKYNWVTKDGDILEQCLRYFGVPDVWTWRKKYSDVTALASFRKSSKLLSKTAALSTWIRQGEIQAEHLHCKEWNPEQFRLLLNQAKAFSRQKDPTVFLQKLRSACAECGVALAIAPTPEDCVASGVAKFLTHTKALILLSFRYKSDDQFWFTFFHEAGHLLLHGERGIFVEEEKNEIDVNTEENEANEFALDVLFPGALKTELLNMPVTEKNIKTLANKANVSLGIVVGQLRHSEKIPYNYFSGFIRRYSWEDIKKHF
jgi:HTH-type transcriptional regulator / antitoxin HigA